ncbi:hypothetical protein WME73_48795 [Sorangium sp. So ce302]|uniref:hypothetical protein n=1 Tax=unclassified Sorangium TaxID=2621164 RepID=UPI003F5E2163
MRWDDPPLSLVIAVVAASERTTRVDVADAVLTRAVLPLALYGPRDVLSGDAARCSVRHVKEGGV